MLLRANRLPVLSYLIVRGMSAIRFQNSPKTFFVLPSGPRKL